MGIPARDLVRLDYWLAGEQVGFIKLDVEGFELAVLKGAAQTLARCRPLLYLENDRVDRSPALIEWLWNAGYDLWWHIPPLFNPQNFASSPDNVYGNVASFNMLGVQRARPIQVQGLTPVQDSQQHPLRRKPA